jgi:hypothetical protein
MTRMSIILNTNKIDYMQMTCDQIVVYCNVAYRLRQSIMGRGLYVYTSKYACVLQREKRTPACRKTINRV